ncbi:LysR family transcriptional regulator [uncultured Roseobacter sp.]|uniref:LysR family transcriptional regulator n=1 Tax=uncultured Roseobacter sp. TaxID=114847 RepID=UPI0026354631|nr:LysR family transcriptional regulator [uncultured Roseobacter sp.]
MNEIMKPPETASASKKAAESHSLLHEMIRSFTTLARTLNLSHAVRELGSTRQTVRRHIALLEESKGVELFAIEDRQYRLTEAGEQALPAAQEILARGNAWLQGDMNHLSGLLTLSHRQPNGWSFHQHQQRIDSIWKPENILFREAFRAWTMSSGHIEHANMAHIRPYLMVYRESPTGWICVEMGEKSFYSIWFGWTNARSSIGRPIGQFPGGQDFALMLDLPYKDVKTTGGCRLDQIFTQVPRMPGGDVVPTAYHRMLMGGAFPDGSFALIAVLDRSREMNIPGLGAEVLDLAPMDSQVDFDPSCVKYEQATII